MRSYWQFLVSFLAIGLLTGPVWAVHVGTAFTYQGQLKEGDVPVTETCDFEFRLFDADTTPPGSQVGPTLMFDSEGMNALPVAVVSGLFQVELDFGSNVFNGNTRWLQVDVCCSSPCSPAFTSLSPRQRITATPYAVKTRGIFVDDVERVGVGTSSPASKLHVVGDENDGVNAAFRVTSSGHTMLLDGDEIDTNFHLSLNRYSSRSVHMVRGGGRVAIGTNNTGLGRVVIEQNGGTRDDGLTLTRVTNATRTIRLFVDDSGTRHIEGGERLALNAANNGNIDLAVGGGNVGIGTENPRARLHVQDNTLSLQESAIYNDKIIVDGQDAVLGLYSTSQGDWGSALVLKEVLDGKIVDTWGIARRASDLGSALRFMYGPSSQYQLNPAVMTLATDGEVGIGTTSPNARLDVKSSTSAAPSIVTRGGKDYATKSGENIDIGHWDGSSFTGRMRISPDGNVGIGTSSPQEKLHVNGNLRVDGDIALSVRTGYVSISPAAFRDIERTTIDFQSFIPRVSNTDLGSFSALANVHLPVGATITALRASVDNRLSDSNAGILIVTLYRSQIGFSINKDQLASVGAGPGRDFISTTNINNAVVHFRHSYYVDFNGVVTPSGSPNSMSLYGVIIEYEVSEVLP